MSDEEEACVSRKDHGEDGVTRPTAQKLANAEPSGYKQSPLLQGFSHFPDCEQCRLP
jgi:hypothetical protein